MTGGENGSMLPSYFCARRRSHSRSTSAVLHSFEEIFGGLDSFEHPIPSNLYLLVLRFGVENKGS